MKITPINNEKTFKSNLLLVTKTDLKGTITYANRAFLEIVAISENVLIGSAHNIIRHPDMPKVIFAYLWEYLQRGDEIHAYVKNLCADGSYYWVLANVTPSYQQHSFKEKNFKDSQVIGYHSSRRNPSKEALDFIKPLYKQLLQAEQQGGIAASKKILQDLLDTKGVEYDEFILSI